MVEKGWACNLKYGELVLFAFAMAVLMKTFRKNEGRPSTIVSRILRQFLSLCG